MIQVCMLSINRIFKKLSIVIPVYNEEKSIALLLNKINNCTLPDAIEKEVIIKIAPHKITTKKIPINKI